MAACVSSGIMEITMSPIVIGLSVASIVFCGAIFGFFYAWVCSTMWGLDQADPRVAIAAMQAMNASVRNWAFFPAFFLTPVVLVVTALAARAAGSGGAARLFAAGGGGVSVSGIAAYRHRERADERGARGRYRTRRHRGRASGVAGLFAAVAVLESGAHAGVRRRARAGGARPVAPAPGRQIENDVPHPHDAEACGLSILNDWPIRSSTKSSTEPSR